MLITLISGSTILLGCGGLGMLLAAGCKKRVSQLVQLETAISQLEFDIDFLCLELDESFEKIIVRMDGALKEVFVYIRERLKNQKGTDMQRVWARAFKRCEDEIFLSGEDMQIVFDFSKNLGCGNRSTEKNNIKAALMRLKVAEEEARESAKKNVKMYRGLGLLAGIFIILVLI